MDIDLALENVMLLSFEDSDGKEFKDADILSFLIIVVLMSLNEVKDL